MAAQLPDTHRLDPLDIATVETFLLRAKITTPVVASFGTIGARTVLLVRVQDTQGAIGWGEVFGNFPTHGAENRAHLIRDYLAPLVLSQVWASPALAFETLTKKTHTMTIQCGEPGAFAQAIAGIDIALWDLAARRAQVPLWQLMGGSQNSVPTYASGINPEGFESLVEQKLAEGYNAFKIKTGFGQQVDIAALTLIRQLIGEHHLMTDVNQGWDIDTAKALWREYSTYRLEWIEEPLPADRPIHEWQHLAARDGACIAAGENLLGDEQFATYIDNNILGVVQPDMCKWGGFTKTVPLARRIVEANLSYCPHFLAGAIGLYASAHCLAAVGGPGLLEIDANPNPLREHLTGGLPTLTDGVMTLPTASGLGVEPDESVLKDYQVSLAH